MEQAEYLQEWLSLPYRYASPYLFPFSYLTSSEGCLGVIQAQAESPR